MAEICVNFIDRISTDVYKDVQSYKRGDVVTIQKDGWKWGAAETSGQLMVIKVPGASVDDLSALIQPEPGNSVQNKMLQRRVFSLNLDAYDGRDLSLAEALALKTLKSSKQDPNVFGDETDMVL